MPKKKYVFRLYGWITSNMASRSYLRGIKNHIKMIPKRNFSKAFLKSSKIFTHFATMLQNDKSFERGWEGFFPHTLSRAEQFAFWGVILK